MAWSAEERRLAEVEPLCWKKRANTGSRTERNTIWAPLSAHSQPKPGSVIGVWHLPGLREGHPQDEDKFEGVVEGEPVNSVHSALKDGQEGIHHPVLVVVNIKIEA